MDRRRFLDSLRRTNTRVFKIFQVDSKFIGRRFEKVALKINITLG